MKIKIFLALLLLPLTALAGTNPSIGEPEELLQKARDGYRAGNYCEAFSSAEKLLADHADTPLFHLNEGLFADAWYDCALKKEDPAHSGGRREKERKLLRKVHSGLKAKEPKTLFELFVLATAPSAEGEPYDKNALAKIAEKFPGTPASIWSDFIMAAGIKGEPSKVAEFISRHKDSRLAPTARIIVANFLWLSPESMGEAVEAWKSVRRDYPHSLIDYYTAGERLTQAGESLPAGELKLRPLVLGFYAGTAGGADLEALKASIERK